MENLLSELEHPGEANDEVIIEVPYNTHYITIDNQSCITDGWSDGPRPNRDTTNATLLTDQGGYQFRLFPGGEENPALYDWNGMIPLYKWDGSQVIRRTKEEVEADRAAALLEPTRAQKEAEISTACNAAIVAGMDVETTQGTEHFSLEETDQINLSAALTAVQGGAAGYPYHADGQLCRLFSAEEIGAIAQAATNHKLYHTTLCNHLLTWVRRVETVEEIEAITYSADNLPQDLAENMAGIFTAAAAL